MFRWGSSVALFMSAFTNKVDRKGRVSVPALFRPYLSVPGTAPNGIVVLFRSFQFAALVGCDVERMKEMSERLDTLPQPSDEHDELSTMFSRSHQLTLDAEGRIGLPEDLIAYANLSESARFIGLGKTFQVWEPAAHEAHEAVLEARVREKKRAAPGSRSVAP
jgi:MraZ protein